MEERAPGREHERVLGVGRLDRRLVLDRLEDGPCRARAPARGGTASRGRRGRGTATGSRSPRSGRSGSRPSSARGRRARSRPTRRRGTRASRRRARARGRSRSRGRRARSPGRAVGGADAAHAPLGVRERARPSRRSSRPGRRRPRASREVSFRKMSCETRNSICSKPSSTRCAFGSVCAGFSPIEVERLDRPVAEAVDDLVEPVAGRLGHLDAPGRRELRARPPGRRPAGSRAGRPGSRRSRSGPGRCSGRAARSGRSRRSRGGRSAARGSRATRRCRRRRRAR